MTSDGRPLSHLGFFLKAFVWTPQPLGSKAVFPTAPQGARLGRVWRGGRGGAGGQPGELTAQPRTLPEAPGEGLIHLWLLLHFQNTFLRPPGLLTKTTEWLLERRVVADGSVWKRDLTRPAPVLHAQDTAGLSSPGDSSPSSPRNDDELVALGTGCAKVGVILLGWIPPPQTNSFTFP